MYSFNLHINYDCPLKCRYCVQRENPDLLKYSMSLEEMINRVETFLKVHNISKCSVNISGGEPLLRYSDVQKLIEHFPENAWEISTSGYLLDKEKAKWFSQFNVGYVLSVDGTEKITNYLRPLANGIPGYFKQFKQNISHILYYNPTTRAKLIVPKRFINEIFNTYLELEQLGFNEIFITPNVYENTVDIQHPELSTGEWDNNDWKNFLYQMQLILNEIKNGIENNQKRCLISNLKFTTSKILFPDEQPFTKINVNKMICPVLEFKGGSSPDEGQIGYELLPISICIHDNPLGLKTQKELLKKAKEDFLQLNGVCPRDNNCSFQTSCVYSICLSESIKDKNYSNMWIPSKFACQTQKIYHTIALDFIDILKQYDNDITKYYNNILFKIYKGGNKDGLLSCE